MSKKTFKLHLVSDATGETLGLGACRHHPVRRLRARRIHVVDGPQFGPTSTGDRRDPTGSGGCIVHAGRSDAPPRSDQCLPQPGNSVRRCARPDDRDLARLSPIPNRKTSRGVNTRSTRSISSASMRCIFLCSTTTVSRWKPSMKRMSFWSGSRGPRRHRRVCISPIAASKRRTCLWCRAKRRPMRWRL